MYLADLILTPLRAVLARFLASELAPISRNDIMREW